MSSHIKKDHKYLSSNFIIVLLFLIFACVNTFMLMECRKVVSLPDLQFHWSRILELIKSQQLLPRFAMNSFNDSGSAALTMYPYLFLYPFAIFYKFSKSMILTTVLMLFINTFLSLIVSYFCSLGLSKSRMVSFVFSMAYSLSFSLFYNIVNTYAIGMNDAFIFMPLVLFGYYYWVKYGKWHMLAIGGIALIFSEILMSVLVFIILALLTICNYRRLNKQKIWALLKSFVLVVMVSASFWIPALNIYLNNKLNNFKFTNETGVDLFESIHGAFSFPNMYTNMGLMPIFVLLGIIFGFISFRLLSSDLRQMFLCSLLIIFVSSNIIPWQSLNHTFLGIIQFPWRLFLIPQVFLTYIFAKFLVKKTKHFQISRLKFLLVFVCCVLGLQVCYQCDYFNMTPSNKCLANK